MQDAGRLRGHTSTYGPSTYGPYYEGLLDQPNAKQEYEVLGFFAYSTPDNSHDERPKLNPDPKEPELQAWFYVPRRDSESDPEIQQWKPVVEPSKLRVAQIICCSPSRKAFGWKVPDGVISPGEQIRL
jgi:hypothetical protein